MSDFTERVRQRMPAHRVWHAGSTAPGFSRPANDAMWEEMRRRLRSYEESRASLSSRGPFDAVTDIAPARVLIGVGVAVAAAAAGVATVALR